MAGDDGEAILNGGARRHGRFLRMSGVKLCQTRRKRV